ncbi:MAG: type 1 fimbrial protein [Enterobacteriaceae bacterium]|nr:type 1 fimbrial protein [Enterobacteriaceae bacterium]
MKLKVAALTLIVFSGASFADSTNTVQFKGEVTSQTCSVDINGNKTNPIVLLPTVPASAFTSVGSTTGDTEFTVNVTGCTSESTDQQIQTVFVGNNPTSNGNLGNGGTASNVSIQLLDNGNSSAPLTFANGTTVATSDMTLAAGNTSTSQTLTARYYAEAAGVTAGSVIATAQYAISYK